MKRRRSSRLSNYCNQTAKVICPEKRRCVIAERAYRSWWSECGSVAWRPGEANEKKKEEEGFEVDEARDGGDDERDDGEGSLILGAPNTRSATSLVVAQRATRRIEWRRNRGEERNDEEDSREPSDLWTRHRRRRHTKHTTHQPRTAAERQSTDHQHPHRRFVPANSFSSQPPNLLGRGRIRCSKEREGCTTTNTI